MFDSHAPSVDYHLHRTGGRAGKLFHIEGLFDWEPVVHEGRPNEEIWKQFPIAYEVAEEFMVKSNAVVRDWRGTIIFDDTKLNFSEL